MHHRRLCGVTVIAGYRGPDGAWIAADSIVTNGPSDITVSNKWKVWETEGALVGMAGGLATGLALRDTGLGNPDAIRDWFLAHKSEARESECLVVRRNGIWAVDGDGAVVRVRGSTYALGAGSEFARGALHALERLVPSFTPREMLCMALEASLAHSPLVRRPFRFLELS
jgi:ATP-dependent protease HslVU (ClpYQ) peptidase subunit